MTATWLFLRGLTRDSRHWGGFVEEFRRTVPTARVVMIDLPGNGPLNALASPTDVREMARYCRAEAARLGLSPPFKLFAMSLGAMAAVAWAHAHPREISRAVLVNTSLRPFSPFYRRLRPGAGLALFGLALFGGRARAWEERIFGLTSRLRGDEAAVLAQWIALRNEHPVSRCNALRQLRAAVRYRAPPRPPEAALLLLASRGDALVHPDCSRDLAAAWGCELRLHPSAGHDLPLDDGAWVAEQVRAWLAATEGGAPARGVR